RLLRCSLQRPPARSLRSRKRGPSEPPRRRPCLVRSADIRSVACFAGIRCAVRSRAVRREDRVDACGGDQSGGDRLGRSGAGVRGYSEAEKVRAEVEVTGMDVSRHIVSFYGDVLHALGVTRADRLRKQRQNARVMIAGVKVASQTPAVRSGQRIIFVTLDDGT